MTAVESADLDLSRAAARRPTSANWFVLTVIAGGFLVYLQLTFLGRLVPVEQAFRALLIYQVGLYALSTSTRSHALPAALRISIGIFLASAVASFVLATFRQTSRSDALASFTFMYSIGVMLVVYLVAPVSINMGRIFRMFCVGCLLFGLAQLTTQDLLLPVAVKEHFGIVFEHFVNGRVRVLSVFASAPRFAELLVLMSCFLQRDLLSDSKRWLLRALTLTVTLYVLYNTFSRSGYLLWLVSAFILVILLLSEPVERRNQGRTISLHAIVTMVVVGLASLLTVGGLDQLSVADRTSLVARNVHWSSLVQDLRDSGNIGYIFGTGKSAHYSFLSPEYFVVDNLFLAIAYFAGAVGLACFLFMYAQICATLYRDSRGPGGAYLYPVLAFYVGLIVEGLFVDNHNTLLLTSFIAIGMIAHRRMGLLRLHTNSG